MPMQSADSERHYRPKKGPEWLSGKVMSKFPLNLVGWIPGPGDLASALTLAEIVYNDAREARGDALRMKPEKRKSTDNIEKENYLIDYLLNDFDPAGRFVKDAYHTSRFRRYMRGIGASAALFGANLLLSKIPGYGDLTAQLLPSIHTHLGDLAINFAGFAPKVNEAVGAYTIYDAAIKGMLGLREANEVSHIRGRSGLEKHHGQAVYTDKAIWKKTIRAINYLQYRDEYGNPIKWNRRNRAVRDEYAQNILNTIATERDLRHDAFDAIRPAQKAQMARNSRGLEELDWRLENPSKIDAYRKRFNRKNFWDRKKDIEAKREAKRDQGVHFDRRSMQYFIGPTPTQPQREVILFYTV